MDSTTYFLRILSNELDSKIFYDSFTRKCYDTDMGKSIKCEPIAVAVPKNSEEVSVLIKLCSDYGVPITIRGGGTTIGGETVSRNSILLDTKSLNSLINIDFDKKTAYVESGMTWIELYDFLKRYNLTFKVAPSSGTSTVGGTVSLGGVDNHSYLYGTSTDQVEEVEVVMPNGEIKICNSKKNAEIFRSILYGNGMIGIITKVKIRIMQSTGETREMWYFYNTRKTAFEDYFKLVEGGTGRGAMYFEMLNQPVLLIEDNENICRLKGKLRKTVVDDNFYTNQARGIYEREIKMQFFPFSLRYAPAALNFIDIVYPDKSYVTTLFEYSDKLWSKFKNMSNLRLALGSKVMEDSRTRPFCPIPSHIQRGDMAFGSYFGSVQLSKNYTSYQHEFNEKMIERAVECGCMLYKYCGHVKHFAERMFGAERWAQLIEIKQKYDPENILNRGVLFE